MMNKKLAASPVTQSREAVKQLITYHNHGVEPQEMPDFYRLTGEMVLVLNNKKDSYYVTTPRSCSCPAATYNPGQPCKHSRKYFPQPKREVIAEEPTEGARRLARPEAFKPFDTLPGEQVVA